MTRTRWRRGLHWAALAAALLVGAGMAGTAAASAAARPVHGVIAQATGPTGAALQAGAIIDDRIFIPMELRVPAGTTVTWTNQGRLPHTTTSPGVWDSGRLAPGASWSMRFDAPDTFNYLCSIHPDEMRGSIVVEAAPAAGDSSPPGPAFTTAGPGPLPASPLDQPSGGGTRGSNPAFGGIGSVNPGLANVGAVAGPGAAAAALAPRGDSGVSGEATLLALGAMTTVNVTLAGLAPGSAHAGHIHQDGCDGPILFPLETITADASGQGRATATVDAPLELGSWWVQYHASDSPPGPAIACGQVAGG
jgi:plastocyanin